MATISVTNTSELNTAMAQAKAGDTILLASGNYGAFSTGNDYASAVTIKSANAGAPASFASVSLNGATGITFDSITFDYKFKAGDTLDATPFSVNNSSNIVFKGSVFDGDVASGLDAVSNGYAIGRGLAIIGSNNVTVDTSEIKTFFRGIIVSDSSNVNIVKNDIHAIRSDGVDIAQVQKILLEGNYIHDFRGAPGSTDHSDFIQLFTTGATKATTDVTIKNNTLDIGQGSWTESIFIRNELVDQGQAGTSMYYKNIVIENNTISNNHTHGITVGETDGLIVRNNILISAQLNTANPSNALYVKQFGATNGIMVPQIHLNGSSDNVTVTGNSYSGASWFNGSRFDGYTNQTDWKVAANSYYADKGSIPAGSGASNSGSTPTPTPAPVPDPTPAPTPTSTPTPIPTPVPTHTTSPLGVLDDYVLNLAKLAKTAFVDNAKIITVGTEKVISLDGTKDYVDLGRLTAFEKSEQIAFEVNFSRDVADGKEARLVWNHQKYGLTLNGDGLMIQVATAREGFKTISVGNLGLNDTDNHVIRVIMDGVSNRLQVILDGKVVLNTSSTDLKFIGAGGYEAGWMLGTPWDRCFKGEISDFKIEAKADFVGGTAPATPVVAPYVPVSVVKTPLSGLYGTSATKSGTSDRGAVKVPAADTHKVTATDQHDAVNAKLAALFWGGATKQFGVSDRGALVQTAAEKVEPVLPKFVDLYQTKSVASSARVVVDTGADRLNVLLKQAPLASDDDLDAHYLADALASLAKSHSVDVLPDHVVVDIAPVADVDMWHHVFDAGHALFA
jgi:parallel beta-helix repeat protein